MKYTKNLRISEEALYNDGMFRLRLISVGHLSSRGET